MWIWQLSLSWDRRKHVGGWAWVFSKHTSCYNTGFLKLPDMLPIDLSDWVLKNHLYRNPPQKATWAGVLHRSGEECSHLFSLPMSKTISLQVSGTTPIRYAKVTVDSSCYSPQGLVAPSTFYSQWGKLYSLFYSITPHSSQESVWRAVQVLLQYRCCVVVLFHNPSWIHLTIILA